MRSVLLAAAFAPTFVFAAGSDDEPPTNPTVFCTGGKVYDAGQKKCVEPQNSGLDLDEIYLSVRQLAYAGRYHDAQKVLDAMPENDPRRLTYMGFTHRKLGDMDRAVEFYEQAIAQDPGNILARSYLGQGFVEQGAMSKAKIQLAQIRAYGGAGTWSERSLAQAIKSGTTYNY
jgi:tetratricopeptide (TPR) repeat protein